MNSKYFIHRLLTLCFLASAIGVLVACTSPDHPQSTFGAQGPGAAQLEDLFNLIFWAALFVFVIVGGGLAFTVLRYRQKPGDTSLPPQIHGNKRLEIAWTIAPILVLVVIAIPTIDAIFALANSPDEDALTITVTGHQWWWEFNYDGEDIVTANELHIPADTVVNLNIESADVIHSFWVPKLQGKIDAVPGRSNFLWIQADEPGTYLGQCLEFCGESHANMRFVVIANTKDDFENWKATQKASSNPPSGRAISGSQLFLSKGCVGCHKIDDAGGNIGPNLTHFASRGTFAGSTVENTRRNLITWVTNPETLKAGNLMTAKAPVYTNPDMAMTPEEVSNIVAYLQSLK